MTLERPAWFADLESWWLPAAGEKVAAHVRPLGFDSRQRLHVECDSRAWTTQTRLLAASLAKRANDCIPQYEVTGLIVHAYATQIPPALEEQWQELLGEDLGTQILPLRLGREGQELLTMALSAQARNRFRDLIPEVLGKIQQLLGPGSTLVEVNDPFLYPVTVVVTASDDWHSQEIIDSTLLDTWHDVTQVYGPDHLLVFEHAAYNQADRFVEDWAVRHAERIDGAGLSTMLPAPDWSTKPDDRHRRAHEAHLISRKPDLCLAFLSDPGLSTHLMDAARDAAILVRVISPDATGPIDNCET